MKDDEKKYLDLLAEKYENRQAVMTEIINLNAIMNLPKGTEHFMSDLHGEYEAFLHILNNCSGVIKEKIDLLFGGEKSERERRELCTLIYYPKEKLALLKEKDDDGIITEDWYRMTLRDLVAVAKMLSSKYTRSKVRKAMPKEFSYIIDELIHVQKDEDGNQYRYHEKIYDTIISLGNADDFIIALAALIKRLAVDHLHIVGDIYDRGGDADKIMDLLMEYHSVDIEWGNHDILWMGAACGSKACIANLLRVNLKYKNTRILENRYGISLRNLMLFGISKYHEEDPVEAAYKAISIIAFKLEGKIILRHPEYNMDDRLLLHKIKDSAIEIDGKKYEIDETAFPTVDFSGRTEGNPYGNCYDLTDEEARLMHELKKEFKSSRELRRHMAFLYDNGSLYKIYNGNLIFHGCVPLTEDGDFAVLDIEGQKVRGRELYKRAEETARRAFYDGNSQDDLDFMWFLWGGELSPLCGRKIKTFERMFISDESTWEEQRNPYDSLKNDYHICDRVLREFGLYGEESHIINGHTPVRAISGENPVKAGGRLIVIDGGFNKAMHKRTGLAGYTLIFNSHGLRLKSHRPFESVAKVLSEDQDIESSSEIIWQSPRRLLVKDTDIGAGIKTEIDDLTRLIKYKPT